MSLHCVRCGRFVGDDAIELQNPDIASPSDPDGWTGTYVCAPSSGCHPERRSEPREKTERRTHKRIHDWDDRLRHDSRIT